MPDKRCYTCKRPIKEGDPHWRLDYTSEDRRYLLDFCTEYCYHVDEFIHSDDEEYTAMCAALQRA